MMVTALFWLRLPHARLRCVRSSTHCSRRSAKRAVISALNCQDEKGLMKGLKSSSCYLRHELGQKVDLR